MTSPLRVILVMPTLPIPFGNAAARWYYVLLRGLVAKGHKVTVLAVSTSADELQIVRNLFPRPEYDLRIFPPGEHTGVKGKWSSFSRPYSYLFSTEFRHNLDSLVVTGYDILHFQELLSGWLVPQHRHRAVINVHYLSDIDLRGQKCSSIVDQLRRARVCQSERHLLRRYSTICTLSPRLTEHVARVNPDANVYTVPLGLDLSLYKFRNDFGRVEHPVVGLIGSFDWTPTFSAGVRLLTRLWPEIRRQVPTAALQIVGRRARTMMHEYINLPGITVYEDVPDTLPYFYDTDVMLYAPNAGSGMKVKVLEAFALGIPVVTTTDGIEGIPCKDGVHAGVSDSDAGLIDRTVILLRDMERRQQQRLAARELLQAHCGPVSTISRVERMYEQICQRAGSRTGISNKQV